MQTMKTSLTLVCLLWLPATTAGARAGADTNVLSVGLKGGVGLPQLSSSLETTFYVHLELAYQFPFWGSRLGLVTALGYSQPIASGTGSDPRLPDGTYSWETTQRQTVWDIGILLKFMPVTSSWNVGVLAGSRLMFLSTLTNGEAGDQEFGEHDERATVAGLLAGVQAEYVLGPGALFAELSWATAFEGLDTTGDLALAEVGLLAGYRFTFSF